MSFPYRPDKRKAEEMSSYSASSEPSQSQRWRNEMAMELSEPEPLSLSPQEFFKDFQRKYAAQQFHLATHHGHESRPILASHHGHHGQHGRPSPAGQLGQPGLKGPHGQPGLRGQPGHTSQPGNPMEANATVCCDRADCGQNKIEQIFPEQYMHEPDYIYVSATPFKLMPQPDAPQAGMKDGSPGGGFSMYCPCGLNRGQLVTICCTGRDCDESTKIDSVQMGPPEEKRAKTTYNQFKF